MSDNLDFTFMNVKSNLYAKYELFDKFKFLNYFNKLCLNIILWRGNYFLIFLLIDFHLSKFNK